MKTFLRATALTLPLIFALPISTEIVSPYI